MTLFDLVAKLLIERESFHLLNNLIT